MMTRPAVCRLAVALCASATYAAEWTPVAPGIDYTEMTLDGPVRVYIARADRQVNTWTVDSMIPQGKAKGTLEVVPAMAERYDDTVDEMGRHYEVKVAINGDYWNLKTNVPVGGQITGGWLVRRFGDYVGGSGFIWKADRGCVLGGNVQNGKALQRAVFADRAELNIIRVNDPRGRDELVLYTYHYDASTLTSDDGVEVLVRMATPLSVCAPRGGARGEIVQVRRDAGDTPMPYGHLVLSAQGAPARKLLAHAKPGTEVRFELGMQDFGIEEAGLAPAEWRGAWASIGGPKTIVADGKVPRRWWEDKAARQIAAGGKSGAVVADPRTLIAYNDRYLYFVVADGRWSESVGLTFTQAGTFCVDHLQATYAVLQDGGGSSTMWVDGKVRNNPSDFRKPDRPGQLRAVANGYLMAVVRPAELSKHLQAGATVPTKAGAELRLGPGTHYAMPSTLMEGQKVKILPHALNGARAKGASWWRCSVAGGESGGASEGWVREDHLQPAAPAASDREKAGASR